MRGFGGLVKVGDGVEEVDQERHVSDFDISDPDEGRAWLESMQPDRRLAVACRATFRTLPIIIQAAPEYLEMAMLFSFRRVLLTTVRLSISNDMEQMPSQKGVDGETYERGLYQNLVEHDFSIGRQITAAYELDWARYEYETEFPESERRWSPANTLDSIWSSAQALTEQPELVGEGFEGVRSDTLLKGLEFQKTPMWQGLNLPERIARDHAKMVDHLSSSSEWSFWLKWYLGMWEGTFDDWELAFEVAHIDSEIWNEGVKAVAAEIQKLTAANLEARLPQTTRIEFDAQQAKFKAIPQEVSKPDLLGATLNQIEDALEDALANASNGLNDQSREVKVLNRTFKKYGNDPQQIEMGLVSTHASLTRQMLSEELPASEENLALQSALEEGALGIRATHPEIAENRSILSQQRFAELSASDKEVLRDALPIVQAISDEDMSADWEHDIPALINTSVGPLPSGSPALPGADEATRIFSRVAKMSLLMKSSNVVRAIDDSAPYKALRIGTVLYALVMMGSRLLSLF